MQLHQLVYFIKVAEKGSINKAAEELFLSQPNLSQSIKSLEQEIGVPLFIRNNKGTTLTEDGKKLYEYASVIIQQMGNHRADVTQGAAEGIVCVRLSYFIEYGSCKQVLFCA